MKSTTTSFCILSLQWGLRRSRLTAAQLILSVPRMQKQEEAGYTACTWGHADNVTSRSRYWRTVNQGIVVSRYRLVVLLITPIQRLVVVEANISQWSVKQTRQSSIRPKHDPDEVLFVASAKAISSMRPCLPRQQSLLAQRRAYCRS